jgi:hypothetical protein
MAEKNPKVQPEPTNPAKPMPAKPNDPVLLAMRRAQSCLASLTIPQRQLVLSYLNQKMEQDRDEEYQKLLATRPAKPTMLFSNSMEDRNTNTAVTMAEGKRLMEDGR